MHADFDPSSSYDAVPYSSHPYAKSHPRNLAAIATLFGMSPPDVETCRVLEIGCAAGGNLLPMADQFRRARFHGIDASKRQIEAGQQVINDLRLHNITLQQQDVMEFSEDAGEFDYIICHGVYSWVPPEVQQAILEVCRSHLSAHGVAYVSYNTYPGWYLRRGVREMMGYHSAGFSDPQTRIDQSRALLDFLISAVTYDSGAYERLLHEELTVLQSCEDSYLFHEHLEDHNEPLFFNQFAERAQQAQLRFLAEAHFSSMMPQDFPDNVQQTLTEIAPDIIRMEQYLDFLRNRKFRQTLLCHQNVSLNRSVEPERLLPLFVSSRLTAEETSTSSEYEQEGAKPVDQTFAHPNGKKVTVTTPLISSAITHLASIWPTEVTVRDLARLAWLDLPIDHRPELSDCESELAATMLQCYSSDLVDLFSCGSAAVASSRDCACVSDLARYQAGKSHYVVNARHESVHLSEFDRQIVQRLDGTTPVSTLIDELQQKIEANEIAIEDVQDPTAEDVVFAVHHSLNQIANAALLIS